VLTLGLIWVCGPASAQEIDETRSRSDALFREGLRQLEDGNIHAACENLASSYELLPRTGTLLNLGVCHAHAGQLLQARRELLEVRALAERDQQSERVASANRHLAEIEAQLGWLRIEPAPDLARSTAQLRLDGAALETESHDAIAVMPGEHTVRLEADGFSPRELTVSVGRGARVSVVFQPLQVRAEPIATTPANPAAVPVGPIERAETDTSSQLRTIALVTGIAGMAASLAFGAWAIERMNTVQDRCPDQTCVDESGLDAAETGETVALVSTIAFGVGVTGFGAWLILPGGPLNSSGSADQRAGLTVGGVF
jgi:hypothetical protein